MTRRLLPLLLCVAALGGASIAQTPRFSELWSRHCTGADVADDLRALAVAEDARLEERFNASYLLAVIALGKSDAVKAMHRLDDAERLTPDTPQVKVRRAEAHIIERRFETAEKELAAAAKLIRKKRSPLHLRYSLVAARLDGKRGKATRGLARLDKIASRFKKSWELHFLRGHLHETRDEPAEALAAYEKAIDLLPQRDPTPGIYALQRWAAIAVSSAKGSYGDKKIRTKAIARYNEFLKRAEANAVSRDLQEKVRQAVSALEYFATKD